MIRSSMPLGGRVVALIALLWYLFGLLLLMLRLATLPAQAETAATAIPFWFDLVSGLAVVAGTSGSVALLLARRWAVPMLLAAFVAVAALVGAGLALQPALFPPGPWMPLLLVLVVGSIWLFARAAARRGWLR
ncbi:hypothetical protein [Luteimonas sp. TWI1416]|uniref:hypothetical protein n=1 Tax=unclassified Luteimonas TaxID=2629088 RepID=UPI00320ACDD9